MQVTLILYETIAIAMFVRSHQALTNNSNSVGQNSSKGREYQQRETMLFKEAAIAGRVLFVNRPPVDGGACVE